MGCPIVVQYWEDLQSVNGFRCYDNIARKRNDILALCLVIIIILLLLLLLFDIRNKVLLLLPDFPSLLIRAGVFLPS